MVSQKREEWRVRKEKNGELEKRILESKKGEEQRVRNEDLRD